MTNIFQNPEFLEWVHQLTTLGYEENIMIETEHADVVELYFKEGKTPEQALIKFKDFLPRWEALKSGNWY